jgi:hypothetical protein
MQFTEPFAANYRNNLSNSTKEKSPLYIGDLSAIFCATLCRGGEAVEEHGGSLEPQRVSPRRCQPSR